MMPATHGLFSWLLANVIDTDRRGRIAITLAGVIPDLDGLGYPVEALTRGGDSPLFWFEDAHHVLLHNLPAGILLSAVAFVFAGKSWKVAAMALAAFHFHLLFDLAGSAGEGGEIWPICYLWPFSGAEFAWTGQWRLDSPMNIVFTLLCEAAVALLAWRRGFSPIELLSPSLDAKVLSILSRLLSSHRPR